MSNSKNNRGRSRGDSGVYPFHTITITNLVAGALGILVQPSAGLSPRLLNEADNWAHFRVKTLMFRLHPLNAVTNLQVVGYVGGVQDTPPASVADVMQLLPSTPLGGRTTVASDWVRVPKADLAGPFPWYKTIPGAADPTEEAPGAIIVAGSTTDAFQLEIRGVVEFKTAVSATNTPLARELAGRIREERMLNAVKHEREVLLKALALKVPSTAM